MVRSSPRTQQRLTLLATAFLFPSAGATLTLPWLICLRLWRQAAERHVPWVHTVLDLPLAAFLVLALIAGLRSPMPDVALGSWVLTVLAFAVVLQTALGAIREDPNLARRLRKAFAVGTLCASIYGLTVFYFGHTDRAQLLTLGPNALGFGLVAGIFLSAPLLEEPFPWPAVAVTTIPLSLIVTIATFSREALYGLAAGAVTYLWMARHKFSLRFFSVILLSLVIGSLSLFAVPWIHGALADQLRNVHVVQAGRTEQGVAVLSKAIDFVLSREGNADRLVIWQTDVRVIRDHPWSGVGLGVFPFIMHRWAAMDPRSAWMPQGTTPHSIYLGMAAETGIPGAIAFVAMPIGAIWWAARRGGADRHAALAAMVAMLVGEIRDTILIGLHMALGFILVLAMLAAPTPGEGKVA